MKKLHMMIIIAATVVIVLGLAVQAASVTVALQKIDRKIENTTEENDLLKKELEELRDEALLMETDEFIEQTARTKLGLVKEDEILFREK
ncbi:MAG: hypothetical protein BEN19_04750 [Epulopiscium sp. Nuni2H_MBin003]|nr:MAG: hypothetical protein BEN19_04750 [Epulopiscium sp. Nuni2H_MBin003]